MCPNDRLLPSGFIHGVYTMEDSVVMTQSFLSVYDLPSIVSTYQEEKRAREEARFTIPDLEV